MPLVNDCTNRLCAALATLWLGCSLLLSPAQADQTDPLLDQLFEILQSTDDPLEAVAIDQEIWRRWTASGSPEIDQMVHVGLIAMQAGRFDLAETVFTDIVAKLPKFAEAWNKRATIRYLTGDYSGSLEDCKATLALEMRHYGALSGLGLIHLALGDKAEALSWFEKAISVNPRMEGLAERISTLRKELKGQAI
jgi:tetratricopeptide (TPR) repeat protein